VLIVINKSNVEFLMISAGLDTNVVVIQLKSLINLSTRTMETARYYFGLVEFLLFDVINYYNECSTLQLTAGIPVCI
jgi:hypothetical protein